MARIVVRGYTQIPGVGFTKNYSPVVTDVTLCIILLVWLINNWDSQNIDSKTEFDMKPYRVVPAPDEKKILVAITITR